MMILIIFVYAGRASANALDYVALGLANYYASPIDFDSIRLTAQPGASDEDATGDFTTFFTWKSMSVTCHVRIEKALEEEFIRHVILSACHADGRGVTFPEKEWIQFWLRVPPETSAVLNSIDGPGRRK